MIGMTIEERIVHRELLEQCLRELSSSVIDNDDIAKIEYFLEKFRKIYSNEYRHDYSGIFQFVVNISENENNEYLSTNIMQILEYLDKNDDNNDIRKNIIKLNDHVNLEFARMQYFSNPSFLEKSLGSPYKKELEEIIKSKNETYSSLVMLKRKIDGMQKEFITVIGIFITIIITVTSGSSILSSAFTSISSLPVHKALLYISLGTVAVSNITTSFVYMISKLLDRNISISCRHEPCGSCTEKCSSFNKIRMKYPYLFWMNQFFIVCFLASLAWNIAFFWIDCGC